MTGSLHVGVAGLAGLFRNEIGDVQYQAGSRCCQLVEKTVRNEKKVRSPEFGKWLTSRFSHGFVSGSSGEGFFGDEPSGTEVPGCGRVGAAGG